MKVALVHEYLVTEGGAEKVFYSLLKLFPNADVFTSIYNPKVIKLSKKTKVFTSFIQYLPFAKTRRHLYFALMPRAFEIFDFSDYDLVISDSHSYAKAIKVPENVFHFCYCHTPTRYFWLGPEKHIKDSNYHPVIKKMIPRIISVLKKWDFKAAQRPHVYVANSNLVSERIKKFYHRVAKVIYPPVEAVKIKKIVKNNHFVIISRLEPHKKIDIACRAFSKIKDKLIVIGKGTQEENLKKIASENVIFTGYVSDREKWEYLSSAKALIFPQEEDFGITAIEAQMIGVPVIAFRGGSAEEIIIDNKTGILFDKQNAGSLISAIKRFNQKKFDSEIIKIHAQKFSKERFEKQIKRYIMRSFKEFKQGIK